MAAPELLGRYVSSPLLWVHLGFCAVFAAIWQLARHRVLRPFQLVVLDALAILSLSLSTFLTNWMEREGADSLHRPILAMATLLTFRALLVPSRALWTLDRLDEAKTVLDRLLARDPGHAKAWATLGRIYRDRGETASAQGALRQAIEADTESIEARFILAKIALRDGDRRTFDRLLEEIQAIEAGLGQVDIQALDHQLGRHVQRQIDITADFNIAHAQRRITGHRGILGRYRGQ